MSLTFVFLGDMQTEVPNRVQPYYGEGYVPYPYSPPPPPPYPYYPPHPGPYGYVPTYHPGPSRPRRRRSRSPISDRSHSSRTTEQQGDQDTPHAPLDVPITAPTVATTIPAPLLTPCHPGHAIIAAGTAPTLNATIPVPSERPDNPMPATTVDVQSPTVNARIPAPSLTPDNPVPATTAAVPAQPGTTTTPAPAMTAYNPGTTLTASIAGPSAAAIMTETAVNVAEEVPTIPTTTSNTAQFEEEDPPLSTLFRISRSRGVPERNVRLPPFLLVFFPFLLSRLGIHSNMFADFGTE